ncbi:MAG: cytidylate kinase family protein [Clostridia bacterium]
MGNFVITIARGFGSGGKEIASAVAKDLGIHCYENRICLSPRSLPDWTRHIFRRSMRGCGRKLC